MARLFHDGAELGFVTDLAAHSQYACVAQGATTPTIELTKKRSGSRAYKCSCAGTSTCNMWFDAILGSTVLVFTTPSTTFPRAYFCFDSLPIATRRIFDHTTTAGASTGISARLTSAGKLQLFNNVTGAQIGSDSVATIAADGSTQYCIEMKIVISSGGVITDGELRLDGTTVASFTGLSITVGSGMFLGWSVASSGAQTDTLYIDDIACNDNTGSDQNTWVGTASKIGCLFSTADGSAGTFTNDAGAATSLWDAINNIPPAGIADTTASTGLHQIRSASGSTTAYVGNMPTTGGTLGVASGDTINLIQQLVSVAAPSVTGAKTGSLEMTSPVVAAVAFKNGATAAANFWSGAAAGAFPTGWHPETGSVAYNPTLPSNSGPVAKINVTGGTSARVAMCCLLVLFVDWTPVPTSTPKSDSDVSGTVTEDASINIQTGDVNAAVTELVTAFRMAVADANTATVEDTNIKQVATDVNAATTEAAVITVPVSSADVNGATTETFATKLSGFSDSNATTTEATAQTAQIPSSDANGATTETAAIAVPSADTNGATTEATAMTAQASSSDVNAATTETSTPKAVLSSADVNGTTTETFSISGNNTPVSSSDSNGATTEATALTAQIPASDVNGAVTEVAAIRLSGADTNSTTSETVVVVAIVPASDSNGATTETFSLALTGSDTNSVTTESTTSVAQLTSADANGTTTETSTTGTITFINGSDSNGATTEAASAAALLTANDANSTTTEVAVPRAVLSGTDTNSTTTETTALVARYTSLDAGSGSDAASLAAQLLASDSNGATTEASLVSRTFFSTDVGQGADVAALHAYPLGDDAWTAVEVESLFRGIIIFPTIRTGKVYSGSPSGRVVKSYRGNVAQTMRGKAE